MQTNSRNNALHQSRENTVDHVQRLPSGRWLPGQSPNPGGRPKGTGAVRGLARQHTDTAITALVELCEHGQNEMARIAAANAILDRGWGRSSAVVEMPRPPIDVIAMIEEAHRHATQVAATSIAIEAIAAG